MSLLDKLNKEAENNSWSHAYLFVGKDQEKISELINFIIKSNKVNGLDVSVVTPLLDSGKKGEIKIDQVKALLHEINLTPNGTIRVAIIYNCEKLNQSSANLLLKALEEPPSKIIFILVSQDNSVLLTIKSRCRIFQVPSIPEGISEEVRIFFESNFLKAEELIDRMVKDELAEDFLDKATVFLRGSLLEQKEQKFVNLLHYLHKLKNGIKNNANVKVTLECLWFKGKEIYGRS